MSSLEICCKLLLNLSYHSACIHPKIFFSFFAICISFLFVEFVSPDMQSISLLHCDFLRKYPFSCWLSPLALPPSLKKMCKQMLVSLSMCNFLFSFWLVEVQFMQVELVKASGELIFDSRSECHMCGSFAF